MSRPLNSYAQLKSQLVQQNNQTAESVEPKQESLEQRRLRLEATRDALKNKQAAQKQIYKNPLIESGVKQTQETIEQKKARLARCANIIKNVNREGSIIYTDEWKEYNNLTENNFNHYVVCHKYHFVNPITGVHTQHVESYNNKLKKKIKLANGIKNDNKRLGVVEPWTRDVKAIMTTTERAYALLSRASSFCACFKYFQSFDADLLLNKFHFLI